MNAAVLCLILASVLWGTTGTAASFFGEGVSPIAIGSSTMAIGGILLFARSVRSSLAALRSRAALPWLLLGSLGVVAYPLAFYAGMDLAGVAVGNVIALGSGPIFAALFEWLWERHRLSLRAGVSTAVAVLAVGMLGLAGRADSDTAAAPNAFLGALLGLVAGFAYALYTYSSTRAIRGGHSGSSVMGATFGLGALGLLPVLLLSGAPLLASGENIAIAAYLAIGPMFIAYLLFGRALGRLRSSSVTTVTLLEPVVATLLAVVVVGERLSVVGWIAVLLILAAVFTLVSARPAGKTAPPP